jgi:hypothetical protein
MHCGPNLVDNIHVFPRLKAANISPCNKKSLDSNVYNGHQTFVVVKYCKSLVTTLIISHSNNLKR